VAPTTSAVVDAAPPDRRGAAAAVVMVVRLLGLSVGLSALTAWALARFNALRSTIELPPLSDPGFGDALREAQAELTTKAIAETFTAAAVVLGVGLLTALAMRRRGVTMDDPTTQAGDEEVPPEAVPASVATASPDALEALSRRLHLVVGVLALLLAGALALIVVLFSRIGDGSTASDDELDALRAELVALQADVERVEAGAALYASQITGFQEQLEELGPQVSAGIDEAISGLESFGSSTLSFEVNIDEQIPIATEVVIDRDVLVPIDTAIPINQTFDTTIEVETPLGFSVPVDVSVPVDIEVPIDLEVTIPVRETIPIEETFPVQLDIPIDVDVSETELAELTTSLVAGLESFRDVLNGLGG
jgi:prefoldin subunit 5